MYFYSDNDLLQIREHERHRGDDLSLNRDFTFSAVVNLKETYRKLPSPEKLNLIENLINNTRLKTNSTLQIKGQSIFHKNFPFFINEECSGQKTHYHILFDLSYYIKRVKDEFKNNLINVFQGDSFEPKFGRVEICDLEYLSTEDYLKIVRYDSKTSKALNFSSSIKLKKDNSFFAKPSKSLINKLKSIANTKKVELQWVI